MKKQRVLLIALVPVLIIGALACWLIPELTLPVAGYLGVTLGVFAGLAAHFASEK